MVLQNYSGDNSHTSPDVAACDQVRSWHNTMFSTIQYNSTIIVIEIISMINKSDLKYGVFCILNLRQILIFYVYLGYLKGIFEIQIITK